MTSSDKRAGRSIALMGAVALLTYWLLTLTPWPYLAEAFAIPATVAMVLVTWWPYITKERSNEHA